MSLESATYISDLVSTNPAAGDLKSQGDDHLRLIKSTVKATFPNVSGAVTPTHTELNYVDGVTSAIQTQFAAKAPLASPTFTGTVTVPTPSNNTDAATKAYADSLSYATAFPTQTGNSGKFLTTNGTVPSWSGAVPTDVGANTLGCFCWAASPAGSVARNATVAGANLIDAQGEVGGNSTTNGAALSGTWRAMSTVATNAYGVFQRVA